MNAEVSAAACCSREAVRMRVEKDSMGPPPGRFADKLSVKV